MLLPAKPDPLLPAKPDCQRGESDHFTATSFLPVKWDPMLPAKLVSPLPPKPDLLLPACFWEVQIHHYHLALSEARLSEWACQSSETNHIRCWTVNIAELCGRVCFSFQSMHVSWVSELVGVVRVRVYACQSSKYISNSWIYSIIHKLQYVIHVLQLHYSNDSTMVLVNNRYIIIGYQKQLWGVLHKFVLLVLQVVTVGHLA